LSSHSQIKALQKLDALRAAGSISTEDYIQLVGALSSSSSPREQGQASQSGRRGAPGGNPLANAATLAGGVAAGSVAGDWISEKVLGNQPQDASYEVTANWHGTVDENGVITGEYSESVDYAGPDADSAGADFDFGV
jgi:hypothetical protein